MINRFKAKTLADVNFAELIRGSLLSFILKILKSCQRFWGDKKDGLVKTYK
jgi:hypothetical protein